jgi:DnaK suppressor protein
VTTQAKTHLSTEDLAHFRAMLIKKRDDLQRASSSDEAARRGIHDEESESGDLAEQVVEQDAALKLGAFDEKLVAEIDHALTKFDAGTYGVSETSGHPIPRERLMALPWARGTVDEKR